MDVRKGALINVEIVQYPKYLQTRKVNDTPNVWVFNEHFIESRLIGDVEFVEDWSLSAYQLNAVQNLYRRVEKVVNYNNFVAGLEEGKSAVGPDEANTTKSWLASLGSGANGV